MNIIMPRHLSEDNNQLVLGIGPKQSLVIHLLAFRSNSPTAHNFPYNFITDITPLFQPISIDGVSIPIATTNLLIAMKTHALKHPLIFESDKNKHQNDLDALLNLSRSN